jgi:hypothetical protein
MKVKLNAKLMLVQLCRTIGFPQICALFSNGPFVSEHNIKLLERSLAESMLKELKFWDFFFM